MNPLTPEQMRLTDEQVESILKAQVVELVDAINKELTQQMKEGYQCFFIPKSLLKYSGEAKDMAIESFLNAGWYIEEEGTCKGNNGWISTALPGYRFDLDSKEDVEALEEFKKEYPLYNPAISIDDLNLIE